MKIKILLLFALIITLSSSAFASLGNINHFFCKIVSFDRKSLTASCNPQKPKELSQFKRTWLPPDLNLRMNEIVRIPLNAEETAQFDALNARKSAKK